MVAIGLMPGQKATYSGSWPENSEGTWARWTGRHPVASPGHTVPTAAPVLRKTPVAPVATRPDSIPGGGDLVRINWDCTEQPRHDAFGDDTSASEDYRRR